MGNVFEKLRISLNNLRIPRVVLLFNALLVLVVIGSIYTLVQANSQKSSPTDSQVLPSPPPTEVPTPTVIPTTTPSPTTFPTLKPTAKPTVVSQAQSTTQAGGSFTCTLFLGYSQTNNWFDEAEGVMGSANFEMKWNSGGAAYKWGDANYEGWRQNTISPCSQNANAPDRVVMDITHNEYLNSKGDPVGFMEGVIRNTVSMIRVKYPSARVIVLQPVVGGPNHGTCTSSNVNTESSTVRATVNHPFIHQAIDRVVGGDIARGYDSQVGDCSQYEDSTGHLRGSGQRDVGSRIGGFYQQK